MNYYGNPITRLIEELAALPGIGGKSAQRLAFHILHMPQEKAEALSAAIIEAREKMRYCSDGGGGLPCLREPQTRPQNDYGRRGPAGYGGI